MGISHLLIFTNSKNYQPSTCRALSIIWIPTSKYHASKFFWNAVSEKASDNCHEKTRRLATPSFSLIFNSLKNG
jgi:hypothetical protein